MYTELIFEAELSKDTPKALIDAFTTVSRKDTGIEVTSNKLEISNFIDKFDLNMLVNSCSAYFAAQQSFFNMYYDKYSDTYGIFIRSDLKNYEQQINEFLEFIKPYVVRGCGSNNIYAYVLYELDEQPTIYSLK